MADQEIEEMRRRMAQAAEQDNEGRKNNEPARHKLKLLPEVVALLNKNSLRDSIVDPEVNLLESVRFFLEPLSDGSLPAYDIQKELFASLAKLPVNKDTLVASGIGKVIMFYVKSKKPELTIKRQAERLFTDWTRPILRRTDDYRKKEFAQADYDPTYVSPFILNLQLELLLTRFTEGSQLLVPWRKAKLLATKPHASHNWKLRKPSSARAWSLGRRRILLRPRAM
jgi:transcription factor SPN1